ncbi:MAG: carboxyltransferase domain-containing protein [Rhodocyclaceae bacterium]|nr:MAG: carboxyltransferase domain-containing protein [Rhodocyclaceae bacterium]
MLAELPAAGERPRVVYRQAGDAYLLIEYGPLVLDLELRFRVHALMDWLKAHPQPGIIDLTPGIRSLQLHFDARRTDRAALLAALQAAEDALPAIDDMEVPSRTVYLPLSWDDPATKLAIDKYMQSVRKDAPWCPSNIEFIRRINGLDSIDDVYRTVFDARRTDRAALLAALQAAEDALPAIDDMEVPSRTVYLPLSWDDPATKLAIDKYMQSVRKDAPWCPSNIEFIRRINGLDSIDDVYRTVFDASYLVLGLGDVYLGAPVATPMDPRHRLVTTKYNPARTWTPENAVGIGGAYMCVYGMEGPGGYQFVGRTVQMWNRWNHGARGTEQFDKPWLLRFFDQVRFVPVGEEELLQLRKDFAAGRARLRIEDGVFRLADYRRLLADNAAPIGAFKARQQAAFEAERERWKAAGQAEYISEADIAAAAADSELDLPEGAQLVASYVPGNIWKLLVEAGQHVKAGDPLAVVESMKMEFTVTAPADGEVLQLLCREASPVAAGQDLLILRTATH